MRNMLMLVKPEEEDETERNSGELKDEFLRHLEENRKEIEKDESDDFQDLIKEITGR